MAEIARSELSAQERLSFEMGLHTEPLKGRSNQVFFDFDLNEAPHGFALAQRLRCRFQQARRDRCRRADAECRQSAHPRLDGGRLRHRRHSQSRRQAFDRRRHPQPAQSHHRRLARLFRLRPDRRTECADRRAGRLVLRREHDERDHPHREECRLPVRRRHPRRRSRLPGQCRFAHRHRHEGRQHHRRRRHRRLHRLHDAARAHGDLRQCRQESRRFHV